MGIDVETKTWILTIPGWAIWAIIGLLTGLGFLAFVWYLDRLSEKRKERRKERDEAQAAQLRELFSIHALSYDDKVIFEQSETNRRVKPEPLPTLPPSWPNVWNQFWQEIRDYPDRRSMFFRYILPLGDKDEPHFCTKHPLTSAQARLLAEALGNGNPKEVEKYAGDLVRFIKVEAA